MSSELFAFPDFPIQEYALSFDYETACNINEMLLSSSPPNDQLQNLSLSQLRGTEHSVSEVKTEECNLMQRSYSSHSFDNARNFSYRPQFDQMRRVCSTGDLHKMEFNIRTRTIPPSLMEESHFKVGRYSAEERKERIDRYRAKRTQRNFNKTIKYACRKTLADTRPRVRGRFARNEEIPKAAMFQRYEDDDDLWMYGLLEEDGDGAAQTGAFFDMSNCASYSTLHV